MFYKYQMIKNTGNLELDSRIKGLFKCHAIFSSRINFNDPLDSKIVFIEPTPEELNKLVHEIGTQNSDIKREFESYYDGNQLTSKGLDFIKNYEKHLNKLFDEEYFFYCVSSCGTSNLMWSHYADSHYGFCIEFKDDFARDIDKVIYKDKLPSLKMIDCIKLEFKGQGFNVSGNINENELWNSIRIKYIEWDYEKEYRIYAWEEMIAQAVEKKEKYVKIKYNPEMVESIIFGLRMDESTKRYIIDNIPYEVKFKQSILTDDGFKNIDYKIED